MTRTIGAAVGVIIVLLFFASLGHARAESAQRSALSAARR
jgi:hypothetical protein